MGATRKQRYKGKDYAKMAAKRAQIKAAKEHGGYTPKKRNSSR